MYRTRVLTVESGEGNGGVQTAEHPTMSSVEHVSEIESGSEHTDMDLDQAYAPAAGSENWPPAGGRRAKRRPARWSGGEEKNKTSLS